MESHMAKKKNPISNPIAKIMRRGQNMIHKHHKQEVREYVILGWLAVIVGMIAGIGAVVFRYLAELAIT